MCCQCMVGLWLVLVGGMNSEACHGHGDMITPHAAGLHRDALHCLSLVRRPESLATSRGYFNYTTVPYIHDACITIRCSSNSRGIGKPYLGSSHKYYLQVVYSGKYLRKQELESDADLPDNTQLRPVIAFTQYWPFSQ